MTCQLTREAALFVDKVVDVYMVRSIFDFVAILLFLLCIAFEFTVDLIFYQLPAVYKDFL